MNDVETNPSYRLGVKKYERMRAIFDWKSIQLKTCEMRMSFYLGVQGSATCRASFTVRNDGNGIGKKRRDDTDIWKRYLRVYASVQNGHFQCRGVFVNPVTVLDIYFRYHMCYFYLC